MIGGARSSVVITKQHISENHVLSRHRTTFSRDRETRHQSFAAWSRPTFSAKHKYLQTAQGRSQGRCTKSSSHLAFPYRENTHRAEYTAIQHIYCMLYVHLGMWICVAVWCGWCTGRMCARRPRIGHRPTSKAQHMLGEAFPNVCEWVSRCVEQNMIILCVYYIDLNAMLWCA